MTYTAAVSLAVPGALVVDLAVLRTRLVFRSVFWATYPIMLFFQLCSNGILTGLGVVRYAPTAIAGPRLGYAPVEDLAFGFALVLTSLSLWVWMGRRWHNAVGRRSRAGLSRRGGWPRRPTR